MKFEAIGSHRLIDDGEVPANTDHTRSGQTIRARPDGFACEVARNPATPFTFLLARVEIDGRWMRARVERIEFAPPAVMEGSRYMTEGADRLAPPFSSYLGEL